MRYNNKENDRGCVAQCAHTPVVLLIDFSRGGNCSLCARALCRCLGFPLQDLPVKSLSHAFHRTSPAQRSFPRLNSNSLYQSQRELIPCLLFFISAVKVEGRVTSPIALSINFCLSCLSLSKALLENVTMYLRLSVPFFSYF